MNNYICLLLTSNGCGHCAAFRGDGLIDNGKNYMQSQYIKSLFNQAANGVRLHLLNIHYENMSGQVNFISDISKFSYTRKGILQQRYFRYEGKARLRTLISDNGNKKELGVKDILSNGKKVDWLTLVKEKLPEQIKNYTYYFPCFLIIKTDDWQKAIKSGLYPMPAMPNAGRIIKENNVYKLDKSPQSLNSRNMDVKQMIAGITKMELAITAHEEKTEVKKAEVKNESKAEKKISSTFVIKSYDD